MNVQFFIKHYQQASSPGADAFVKAMQWKRNAKPHAGLLPEELALIDRPSAQELEELAASMGETTD